MAESVLGWGHAWMIGAMLHAPPPPAVRWQAGGRHPTEMLAGFHITLYKARHAHKRIYTVLPKYSKIQVLPGITSCRLVKDNKQAIELNSLLINNMPEGEYG